nr:AraC family transcriptional regulator [Arthrobacter sp. UCD-GKA]
MTPRASKIGLYLADPAQGSRSVGRIAWELGFASQSYFTRAFKAPFGITPLALRQEALRGTDIYVVPSTMHRVSCRRASRRPGRSACCPGLRPPGGSRLRAGG